MTSLRNVCAFLLRRDFYRPCIHHQPVSTKAGVLLPRTIFLQCRMSTRILKPQTLALARTFFSHQYRKLTEAKPQVEVSLSKPTAYQIGQLKRSVRKKTPPISKVQKDLHYISAYATCKEYNLEPLQSALLHQGLYSIEELSEDVHDAVYAKAKYEVDEDVREMFIYREGCVVFWNMPETERKEIFTILNKYSDGQYSASLVEREKEQLDYVWTEKSTNLLNGMVHLNTPSCHTPELVLEKYAFSNALSASVKLGIWEAYLDGIVDSLEPVLEDLTAGKKLRASRDGILQTTGELYTLRHLINLSSDLLEPSDFYWDRDDLERLYRKTCNYLTLMRRVKVINERLEHCCDLTGLLTSHLNDNHHVRLEWMIIFLILIEVGFEIIHYAEKYMVESQPDGDITDTSGSDITDSSDSDITDTSDSDITDTSDSDITDTSNSDITDASDSDITDTSNSDITDASDSDITDPSGSDITDTSQLADSDIASPPLDYVNNTVPVVDDNDKNDSPPVTSQG